MNVDPPYMDTVLSVLLLCGPTHHFHPSHGESQVLIGLYELHKKYGVSGVHLCVLQKITPNSTFFLVVEFVELCLFVQRS